MLLVRIIEVFAVLRLIILNCTTMHVCNLVFRDCTGSTDRMQSTGPRDGTGLEVEQKQRTEEVGPGLPCLLQSNFFFFY